MDNQSAFLGKKRDFQWARMDSNQRPMDYESEMVVITIVFAISYMRVLRQKSGLQVVYNSTYKSLTTQYSRP